MDSDEAELELGLSLGCGKVDITKMSSIRSIFTANDMPRSFSTRETKTPAPATAMSNQAVGWPPVGSYRMNNLITQTKSAQEEEDEEEDKINNLKSLDKVNNISNYKTNQNARKEIIKAHIGFVKVNMDGLPIGRKVDLKAHLCYETLAQAIENMFFKSSTKSVISSCGTTVEATNISKLLDGSSEFVLTYEDKEGDWMLVGDVPWRMFLSTVKRLRIMRTSEANGLAPRFQARN